ncbi:DNA repair protein RecN [soil metagenome]
MLAVLKIRNLALVDSLTWEIGGGLVCVTGETGAGKSVIVGAVKLVLGERADRGLVRTGESACTVEALFSLPDPSTIDALLEENGLDSCDGGQLVIRRVIVMDGSGNRQFVNGSPCTLGVLRALGHHLVDLHGPHDHQSLLSRDRQLAMLDAYAAAGDLRPRYTEAFAQWRDLHRQHQELVQSERANEQEIDLLRFQVGEIGDADLKAGEEEEIEARYRVAANAQRLVAETGAALQVLGGITDQLGGLQRHVAAMEKMDSSTAEMTAGAATAAVELSELEASLQGYLSELEIDPAQAVELESRLDLLQTLKRKYGNSVTEVIVHGEAAVARLAKIESRGAELERLAAGESKALDAVRAAGKKLGAARKKAAPKLAAAISGHLVELGFKRSSFEVVLEAHGDEVPVATGLEQADFLFSPNPGEPLRPLRQTASSGEMSRTMLAVKSALVKEDEIPLLIFDEIDANVGGEIAEAVGRKMAQLGQSHQVVSITHLPQVAALASSHYVVNKEFEGERTYSQLREVAGEARVGELARMLGGKAASARAHAESLLTGR